jgi:hypothetical protein
MLDRALLPVRRRAGEAAGWLSARRTVRTGATTARPTAFRPLLLRLLHGSKTLLDVGCGPMTFLRELPVQTRVGVDAHRPYLEHADRDGIVPVNLDARELRSVFVDRSFDAVTLIDVIEHFEEADALEVLRQIESIARRVCILFTPRGEFPQEAFDAYGLGGEQYQQHRSVWDERSLGAHGYRCVVLMGFHGPWNESFVEAFGPDAEPRDALLAWKRFD